MTLEELTQIATAHQSAIARHDTEIAEIRELVKLNQQQLSINQEQLNQFTAGMIELRNLVGDYIQAREDREREGRIQSSD
jgi:hypothetical protein